MQKEPDSGRPEDGQFIAELQQVSVFYLRKYIGEGPWSFLLEGKDDKEMIKTQELRRIIEKSNKEGREELLEDMGFGQNNLNNVKIDSSVTQGLLDVEESEVSEEGIDAKKVKKVLGNDRYGFFLERIGGPDNGYTERDIFGFLFRDSGMDLTDMEYVAEGLGFGETIEEISRRLKIRIKEPPKEEEPDPKKMKEIEKASGKKKIYKIGKSRKKIREDAISTLEIIERKEGFLKEDLRREGLKKSLNLSEEEIDRIMRQCFEGKNNDFSLTRIYGLKCALRKFTGDRRLEAFNNLLETSYTSIEEVKKYMISEYGEIADRVHKGVLATMKKIMEKMDSHSTVDIDYRRGYVDNPDAVRKKIGTVGVVYTNKEFVNQRLKPADVRLILEQKLLKRYVRETKNKKRFRRNSITEFVLYSDELSEHETLDVLGVLYGKRFNSLDDAIYSLNSSELGFMLRPNDITRIKRK